MTLRKIVLPLLFSLSLALVGCGSKDKSNAAADEALVDSVDTASAMGFDINSSSDMGGAGGLRTVYFAYNSATLSGETTSTLNANADVLKQNPAVEVQIEGHCDERGSIQYNLALGEKRAKAVRDYLVSMGVESRRITIISYGKEKPIAQSHEESSWSQNRRGNFVITAK